MFTSLNSGSRVGHSPEASVLDTNLADRLPPVLWSARWSSVSAELHLAPQFPSEVLCTEPAPSIAEEITFFVQLLVPLALIVMMLLAGSVVLTAGGFDYDGGDLHQSQGQRAIHE